MQTEQPTSSRSPIIPPDVFEALVAIWTDILVDDYFKRHPVPTKPGESLTVAAPAGHDAAVEC